MQKQFLDHIHTQIPGWIMIQKRDLLASIMLQLYTATRKLQNMQKILKIFGNPP
jgi:hypothetical protein